MLKTIRSYAQRVPVLRKFLAYYVAPSGLFDKFLLNRPLDSIWKRRLEETLACPDNQHIPRVPDAGKVTGGKQVMHNGLRIHLGSYYGPEVAQLLMQNKGVHEPQEERVFQEVVASLQPGATMIELGSFWSFYSMWFNSVVTDAKNFMVEPEDFNLGCGTRNFRLNKMKGDFTQAYVGKESITDATIPTICIDDFVRDKNIEFVNMLHSDIQGFEFDMLQGAEKTIDAGKIGFIFISTHSNEVHQQCLNFLVAKQFFIIADSDKNDSYSEDGLIAAHSPAIEWNQVIPIALKTAAPSTAS